MRRPNPSRIKRQHMPRWRPATAPQVLKESHFLLRCLAFRPTLVHLLNSGRRERVEMGCEGAAEVLTASLGDPSLLALMDSHRFWVRIPRGQGAAHVSQTHTCFRCLTAASLAALKRSGRSRCSHSETFIVLLQPFRTTGRLFVLPGINRAIDDAHPARPLRGPPMAQQDGPARFPPPAPTPGTAGGPRFTSESFQLTREATRSHFINAPFY